MCGYGRAGSLTLDDDPKIRFQLDSWSDRVWSSEQSSLKYEKALLLFSWHAQRRMRQRGISLRVINLAVRYGASWKNNRGKTIFEITRASLRRMVRETGFSRLERWVIGLRLVTSVDPFRIEVLTVICDGF